MRRALHRRLLRLPDLLEIGVLALEILQLIIERREALLRGLVGFLLQRLALDLELNDAPLEPIHFLGLRVDFHADARCGFIDQVDGFVRAAAGR